MSQSSFYGGRPGISFRIVKYFDGINIPQESGSIVYRKKQYAYRVFEENEYYIYPFIEKNGQNHNDYDWKLCELDGLHKDVIYNDDTIGTELVIASPAEGMIQCFSQGGATTDEVNYGEFVIIDTVQGLCEQDNPDNGKLFRRGINLNYDSVTNPYYGGELIGSIAGPKGFEGDKGEQGIPGIQGPKGEKGDRGESGSYKICATYNDPQDIPSDPPEVIMSDEAYKGWDILVGDDSNVDTDFHLYVFDYLTEEWVDVGSFIGGGSTTSYAVCSTLGNTAAKTADVDGYVLTTGAQFIIKFENENTVENPTLNVSNTGAKSLIANGESATDVIVANSVFLVVYDGTNYILVGGVGSGASVDFIGTMAEWNALTPAQKNKYADSIIFITDDSGEGNQGHIILNGQNVSMTQRSKLKFIGASVSDDENLDATVVRIQSGSALTACYDEEIALYAHAIGDIIYYNDHLYEVIDAIAVGDTLVVNTNIVAANLDEGLAIYIENIPDENTMPLPIATTSSLGVVQPDGTSITVDQDGVISATGQSSPIATDSTPGIVQPDGVTVTITNSGVISANTPTATQSTLGVVKPDNNTITISNGVLSVSNIITESKILLSSGWNYSQIYDLTSWYPNNEYDIVDVLLDESATTNQRKQWYAADCGGYRSTNTIKANKKVPTSNIPVMFIIRAK